MTARLRRRLTRSWKRKVLWSMALSIAVPLPYFLLQYFPLREPVIVPPSGLDQMIPFLPATMWIYQSLYVLLVLAGFSALRNMDLDHLGGSILAQAAAAFVCFAVFPTAVQRPSSGIDPSSLYAVWTGFEKPLHAVPSLHASFCATLLCFSHIFPRFVRRAVQFWIAAVLVSTLTTEQHVVLDLAAGLVLGFLSVALTRRASPHRGTVLLITGSGLDPSGSIPGALLRMLVQLRLEKNRWFSLKVKAVIGEAILYSRFLAKTPLAEQYMRKRPAVPSLTRVVLEELLAKEGFRVLHLGVSEVHERPLVRERYLRTAGTVFLSTTLLHDLSETEPLLSRLKKPWNHVAAGGALIGSLPADWPGLSGLDVAAMGYGESNVPALAAWIRSGWSALVPAPGGRVEKRAHTLFLQSPLPAGNSLDKIASPSWKRPLARGTTTVYYESVRGCPYRCAFCNYPYLFSDSRFRYRSAEAMFADYTALRSRGAQVINCLDSLFTIPRQRLVDFCRLLMREKPGGRWICYARADDLDLETAIMMKEAGAAQVHIGVESGSDVILENMNKHTTASVNRSALENCRKAGITTIATLITGFPGETQKTLDETLDFMRTSPPDFHFLAAFSTRVAGVPILSPENKSRFGLWTQNNLRTMSPYWAHDTMSCLEAGQHLRRLTRTIIEEKLSIDASLFYEGILDFEPSHRSELLDFQYRAVKQARGRPLFDSLHGWIDRRLARDLEVQRGGASGT